MGIFLALLVICLFIISTGAREAFLRPLNLQNLSRQIALLGIFAVGEALVIIAGGIDLSVGSLIAFSGVYCALLMAEHGWPLLTSILAVLAGSAFIGVVHALLIDRFNLPPFVVTLGSLCMLRSIALLRTNSMPVPVDLEAFHFLGNGRVAGIPVPVLFFVGVAGLGEGLMRLTPIGRYLYALGGNEEAARLSGLKIIRIKMVAYGLCSLLTGLAGVLYAAYNRQGMPGSGVAYELNAIAAAVIGGCSLSGGQGTVLGTVLGACILNVILNGINLIIRHNASLWEGVIVGSVVVLAVMFNSLRQQRR